MDVMSRIVMQIAGTDEVANKIHKVRTEFEETKKAAQGISASAGAGAGSDPFARATGVAGTGPSAGSGYLPDSGSGYLPDPRAGMTRRQEQHRAMFTPAITGGLGAIGQMGSGNFLGGAASGVSAMKDTLGKAAPVALVTAAALAAINAMTTADLDARKKLYTGLGQKLGMGSYESMRTNVIGLEEGGLEPYVMPLLNAAAQGGATGFNYDDIYKLGDLSYRKGIDPATLGKLYGRLQSAGAGGRTTYSESVATAAESGFGRARMGEFYDTLTTAVEGAMEQGFAKGSAVFTDVYMKYGQRLADYGRLGGAAPEGAMAMFNKVQQNISGAGTGINSPEQAMQFMMMRKPGESYLDTLRRMSEPDTDIQRYENLKAKSGGNGDNLRMMLMSEYGLTVQQADRYVATMDSRIKINAGIAASDAAITGVGSGSVDFGKSLDETRRRFAAEAQRKRALTDLQDATGGLTSDLTSLFFGKPKTPEMKSLSGWLSGRFLDNGMSTPGTGYMGAMKAYGNYVTKKTSDITTFLPESMRPFIAGMMKQRDEGTLSDPSNNPVVMGMVPELSLYYKYTKDPKSVTSDEATYLKKYSSSFEQAMSLLGTGKGSIGGQLASSPDAMEKLAEYLSAANEADFDGNQHILSIVEILEAIKMGISQGVFTPAK